MRPDSVFVLAAVAMLALQPAFAQSPGNGTMPAGVQNPAVAQPRLVTPAQIAAPSQLVPSPGQVAPAEPQNDTASPSSMIIPGGAGGLCECLIGQESGAPALDQSKMHQACLASVEACQAVCNSPHVYSFVPHAAYTCPGQPGGSTTPVAANRRRVLRLATSR